MLKNYFRIAFRNLLRNKTFSFITVFGLTTGMAAFLLILHYVRFEKSYENYNAQAPDIVRLTLDFYKGSEYVVTDCETHAGIGPLVKERFPEVKEFVRMFHTDGLQEVKAGTKKFLEEGIYYADPSALDLFAINLLTGNKANVLSAPYQVVLNESSALKFFGRLDVLGELFELDGSTYHVSGIMKDVPLNTHLKFSILLSHATIFARDEWYKLDNWNGNNEYTYLLLAPGTDVALFNTKLAALSTEMKDKINHARYTAQPMSDIHLYSNKTYEPEPNGNARVVYFLLIIAVFIILIAWVNYINLSTSRALERAREVGIRKVMGSYRLQLILQFLSESFVINLLAAACAFTLFQLLLPVFRSLTGQPLPMHPLADPMNWLLFGGLVIIGSVLSGLYPAFVLSSFQPASVLKGKFQTSGHGQFLRKSLVFFQFASTIVLIVSMLTVYLQVNHLRATDLGVDIHQTLAIRSPRLNASDSVYRSAFQSMKTELLRIPGAEKVTQSGSLPGISLHEVSSTILKRAGTDNTSGGDELYYYGIDGDFLSALDIKLEAGRNFQDGAANDDQVIVNEEAIHRLGFATAEEALGTKITFQTRWPGEPSTIVGVIKNFYQRSPKEAHIPMLFQYRSYGDYFSMKVKPGDMSEVVNDVKKTWARVFPDQVFSYFFLDDRFGQQFESDVKFGNVMTVFSVLAVFIACLGLFGLSSYTIIQRTKEIGIRKVLGASVSQIVRLLSGDFSKVIIASALAGVPIAYYAMSEWLSNYAVRITLNAWVFVVPVAGILVIALATVSFQTIKTALSNPVKALKQD